VPARRVAQALESLLVLGLIERGQGGELTQRAAVVSTGAQTASMHIGNYHRAMLKRAATAIEAVPAARRDISSLTLRVRESSIPQLRSKLARFRRELLELEECEADGDQVLQLNLQLFPLTSAEPPAKPVASEGSRTRHGEET
jgi:uncharacterized protein (TIGR02147 family)